jgi:hypothetical protein
MDQYKFHLFRPKIMSSSLEEGRHSDSQGKTSSYFSARDVFTDRM